MTLIKTINLSKLYPYDEHSAETGIADVSLSINQGEFVALRGNSGSGKSTLLNLLACIDSPSGGQYFFCGEDVSNMVSAELSKFRLYNIGLVFQAFYLMWERTVLDNVALPLLYAGYTLSDAHKTAFTLIKEMQLEEHANKLAKKLSGGQQQRVAIARAIINSPRLLLADEPTGNLDEENTLNLLNYFKKINRIYKTTLLIATHDDIVNEYADRVINIRQGKIE